MTQLFQMVVSEATMVDSRSTVSETMMSVISLSEDFTFFVLVPNPLVVSVSLHSFTDHTLFYHSIYTIVCPIHIYIYKVIHNRDGIQRYVDDVICYAAGYNCH
jgi:hypothetical protein